MPLYEYQCDTCGHRFEVIQKFSDAPLADCPKCAGAIRKLLSSPAIQFKGTGWYITDYARKGGNGSSASDGGAKGEAGAKSEANAKGEKGEAGAGSDSNAKSAGDTKSDGSAKSGGAAKSGGTSTSSS